MTRKPLRFIALVGAKTFCTQNPARVNGSSSNSCVEIRHGVYRTPCESGVTESYSKKDKVCKHYVVEVG